MKAEGESTGAAPRSDNRRRVIVPAAGASVRFGGVPKELLPIGENETSLQHAVNLARRIGEPVVITSSEKWPLHQRLLPDVEMVLQSPSDRGVGSRDSTGKVEPGVPPSSEGHLAELWGAIRLGLKRDVPGALILADTVTDFEPRDVTEHPLQFGVFQTKTPERFSVISATPAGPRIATKERAENVQEGLSAWGVIVWSSSVTDFLLGCEPDHYDRIFEQAMREFGYQTFPLRGYHDLGTFAAYREFLIEEFAKAQGRR